MDGNGNVQTVSTLSNTTMENLDLRWERTAAWNFGGDFSILAGKIDGSLEYYNMTTTDLLVERALPNVIGFSSVFTNLGEVQNKGVELSLTTRNIDRQSFAWSSIFNFSLNRNKIVSLYGDLGEDGEELDDITNRWFIVHAIDEIWGLNVQVFIKQVKLMRPIAMGYFPVILNCRTLIMMGFIQLTTISFLVLRHRVSVGLLSIILDLNKILTWQ
ncbi:MAG: TonB-dependent receptor [Saprospiraceae bacterium]|nr:TonB-dependent receptor [Saprospiraceae bacterium]